jgi:hypothetical protein
MADNVNGYLQIGLRFKNSISTAGRYVVFGYEFRQFTIYWKNHDFPMHRRILGKILRVGSPVGEFDICKRMPVIEALLCSLDGTV